MDATTTRKIEALEERLSAYYREHYGPLWGHADEDATAVMEEELHTLYEANGTPEDDRVTETGVWW